ncbi:MAG: hypothetical protein ACRD3J_29485, partial [Thermoanaerobaculia bacterium]
MRITRWLIGTSLLVSLAACGGDSPTGPGAQFDSIAGSYTGTMAGLTQGVALDAVFALSISQS